MYVVHVGNRSICRKLRSDTDPDAHCDTNEYTDASPNEYKYAGSNRNGYSDTNEYGYGYAGSNRNPDEHGH